MNKVTLQDFQPLNKWILDVDGDEKWRADDPKYIIDTTTGRRYWNEDKIVVGIKSFLLACGTPVFQPILLLCNILYCIAKLFVSLFTNEFDLEPEKDIVRILVSPIVLVLLELAAIYGIFNPNDGKKLYASLERAMYERGILAPCFQPEPTAHLFGGDPNQKNAY